jgi:CDP-glucose 4,6-dehydratase
VAERRGAVENLVSGSSAAFGGLFRERRVLVTGHTGFKGSWLALWLLRLGARVSGVSRDIPTQPSMFAELGLQQLLAHHVCDIRDLGSLERIFAAERPEFVFHLAAQPIVSLSYRDPVETISTNAIGTMNVLECLRRLEQRCYAVLITSDKCYDNVEWPWGYRETDRLGGKDVYSGSKAAAEVLIRAYVHSFMPVAAAGGVRLGVGRAGNVIGGGDWAADRVVADCMRAWSAGRPVEIRNPNATRPWQHVLEPLSGYLALACALTRNDALHGEAFNFGPAADQSHTVVELLAALAARWGLERAAAYRVSQDVAFHEAGLLKLNCDKALQQLGWRASLSHAETTAYVADWYREFYRGDRSRMREFTGAQVEAYVDSARTRALPWACA